MWCAYIAKESSSTIRNPMTPARVAGQSRCNLYFGTAIGVAFFGRCGARGCLCSGLGDVLGFGMRKTYRLLVQYVFDDEIVGVKI